MGATTSLVTPPVLRGMATAGARIIIDGETTTSVGRPPTR